MVQRTKKSCSIDGCENPVRSRRLCRKHYERWSRHGDPLAGRPSPQPGSKCSIDGCVESRRARGLCEKHYRRWQRHGSPLHISPKYAHTGLPCAVEGCVRPHQARGWCEYHYRKWLHFGDPGTYVPPEEPLKLYTDAERSFADKTEWQNGCLVWTAGKNNMGYGRISVGGGSMYAHRYSWERANGPIPEGMEIDHMCHTPLCCNPDHLRLATRAENTSYLKGPTSRSQSGFRNVYPVGNKWYVQIRSKGVVYSFGTYDSADEASEVANLERKKLHGKFFKAG